MKTPIYQVDAFTGELFGGNPAAVCPLEAWLPDEILQAVAAENNLSETAFFVAGEGGYELRWFTPQFEVDLCGHATLATAFVILEKIAPDRDEVRFETQSGELVVTRDGDRLAMDFPARPAQSIDPPPGFVDALGGQPRSIAAAVRDVLVVYATEAEVAGLDPDMRALTGLDHLGVIVTAPGDEVDFISRFFCPSAGIPEDPVTGSAYCTLVPYWSQRLDKKKLHARQISKRGGELFCEDRGDRVRIAGRAVLYLEGTIQV
ncbi:MAG: PhzF family phenazine biosynthesis protein [Planctomycetota bacterium]|nr:PhzF family phenazine biosynthesis protein [Planctomycetota bacterium]